MGKKQAVHIRISDTGWILERLARELANRLPYVTYDLYANGAADIQYYMTYGCWQQRVSPIELALFTHKEAACSAAAKFDEVAKRVDFCVAQSSATEQILRGVTKGAVQTISPGVDLARFEPVVRIGVVGRTYHTGRKGEELVRQVMDVPGIEWHFTGPGWPGPAQFVEEEDMPAFYRSLDYVLVPALNEGGPMCVLEALASGCKVIGAPVGWVPEFPHTGFKLGDAADLRRVLNEVVAEKAALRRSVEAYTWEAWATQHHALFTRLLGEDPMQSAHGGELAFGADLAPAPGSLKAAVAVHGLEATTLGGPSVRAPRTAAALRRIGIAAEFESTAEFEAQDFDVVHVLNVWHPDHCEPLLRQVEKNDRPSVLSPIFLDLSERRFFDGKLQEILSQTAVGVPLEPALAVLRDELAAARQITGDAREHASGYFSTIRRLATYPDHLILLSRHEQEHLRQIGVAHPSSSIVKNPIESQVFANGDPALFSQTYGLSDYVLCVGRVESRKNQAILAYALRLTGLPLVFIGHESDARYANLVRKWAAANTLFVGRVEPDSPMLASALAGARVFCLPSWSEGAPLVALEAAAAGCNMVLSDRSSEEEYFGDLARYADPADAEDLRAKIMAAYDEGRPVEKSQRLQQLMREEHSWDRYARKTEEAYRAAQSRHAAKRTQKSPGSVGAGRIYIDLTTLANHEGPPTGIARVEDRIAYEIAKHAHVDVRYLIWNSVHRRFIEVNSNEVHSGQLKDLRGEFGLSLFKNPSEFTAFSEVDFRKGDTLLNFGSGWMRNAKYLSDLATLKRATGIALVFAIYDVIQHNHQATMYAAGTGAEFSRSCKLLIEISDALLTCSQQSAKDIRSLCRESHIPVPPITIFRLGDEASSLDPKAVVQSGLLNRLENDAPFVLYVSTLDARKNHKMLLEIWRDLITAHSAATPTLVLVGRLGWRGEEALEYLASDTVLQTKVLHLEGINDRTLEWLYQNCRFTVYPSVYEGWGLPVAESLRHAKFCIASDGGSLSEVAPGFVEYINPRDFMGWYRALEKYSFSPLLLAAKTAHAATYQPAEWSRTAEAVLKAVAALRPSDRLPSISIGEPLSLCTNGTRTPHSLSEYLLGGWSQLEVDGTWTVGTKAVLGFQLTEEPPATLALKITASAFVVHGQPVDVVVAANGVTLANWLVGSNVEQRVARVPASVFDSSRLLRLDFRIANPNSPAGMGLSTDPRLLGLKLETLILERFIELQLDQWTELGPTPGNEWSLHCPNLSRADRYIALDIAPDSFAKLELRINGRGYELLARHGMAGPRVRRYVPPEGMDLGSDTVTLSVRAVHGSTPVVTRLGFFQRPPREALRLAMTPLDAGSKQVFAGSMHVRFGGTPATISLDTPVHLGGAAAVLRGRAGGWYAPEPEGVWASGRPASLYARLNAPFGRQLRLTLEYACYSPLCEAGADFNVAVGSAAAVALATHVPGDSQGGGTCRQDLVLSAAEALDEHGVLAITVWASGSLAPADIGDSPDTRPLALFVRAFQVESVAEPIALELHRAQETASIAEPIELQLNHEQAVTDQEFPPAALQGG